MIPNLKSGLKRLRSKFLNITGTDPRLAYNLWANWYDDQPGNLMIDLDELIFSELLKGINLQTRRIIDVGCGTGRHWPRLIAGKPLSLTGFDVSEEMLKMLRQKFPGTHTELLTGNQLPGIVTGSCDLVCSTLTVAHIRDLLEVLTEWSRVLKIDGDMIITDFHPDMLQTGGQRTFKHQGRLVVIRNYIHTIQTIRTWAKRLHLKEVDFIERRIDENVLPYYERQNALHIYEKFKGSAVIYGIHFKKTK
jgi:ubiquinone/menaquinone biosynthesis C-methylase UbiE